MSSGVAIEPEVITQAEAHPASHGRLSRAVRSGITPRRFLWLLLIIFLFKGILIALVFPAFSGHDEVMHYAYLTVLAEEGRVPIIPDLEGWREQRTGTGVSQPAFDHAPAELYRYADNDPDLPYKTDYVLPDWFGGQSSPVWAIHIGSDYYPSGWIYTANHPPLFYMLMTPVYWLVDDLDLEQQVHVFRMATIPFGMLTVVFAYLTVRAIFPRDRFLAMTVPAFIAFQPQISYEASMLNNDILAIMFTSAVIWLLAVGLRRRFPIRTCLLIGLFLGLAILSKSTSVITGPLIGIAMIFGLHWREWRQWLPKGALVAGVATLIALPWIAFMMMTYGDPTALNRVSDLQYWNYGGGEGRSVWSMLSDKWFFWNRWNETWGDFGWRVIKLPSSLMRILLWLTLFGTVGLAVYALRFLRAQRGIIRKEEQGRDPGAIRMHTDETLAIMPWQVTAVLTMGVACVLGYYSILQFGTTFSLTQARYYFPMIVPGAVLLMLGFRSWFPRAWLRYVGAVIFLGLVMLNLIIYTAHVIPYWNPGV